MSFILDALRKSDAERQRQSTPGLADIRYARRRARRWPWIPLLVVVLVANLAFMAFQWWRGSPETPPAPSPPVTVAPPPTPVTPVTPAAPAEPVAVQPEPVPPTVGALPLPPEVRPLAGEADAAPAMAAARPADDVDEATAEPAIDLEALLADEGVKPATAAPAPAARSRIREETSLPTSQQLLAAGTLRVPEISLELHVYSDDPARRFVIINGRRYREGATLAEGPVVESITTEGAVLDSQGTRFMLLPR
jgi:general secretion pathway protein B